MNTYKIAELIVNMESKGRILDRQGSRYRTHGSETADITIAIADDFLTMKHKENPHLTTDECEYIWTGGEFYHQLLDFHGFMLHASAIAIDNRAYLFSALSGTGKSTHTELWQKHFGENRAVIINDDKPAMRFIDNQFYVYGTPWSGKSDKSLDIKVPLSGIVFIERAPTNWITRIDGKPAIRLILQNTLRPQKIAKMDALLVLVDQLLTAVPIYKMGCDISENAVELVYRKLKEEKV